MVPMRVIFEAFGAEVEWFDEGSQSITATLRSDGADEVTIVYLYIGEDYMYVAEKTEHEFHVAGSGIYLSYFVPILEERIELDVPPQIFNGRTLVPLRAVPEVFGASVEWNAEARTVTIKTQITSTNNNNDLHLREGFQRWISENAGTSWSPPLEYISVRWHYGTFSGHEIVRMGMREWGFDDAVMYQRVAGYSFTFPNMGFYHSDRPHSTHIWAFVGGNFMCFTHAYERGYLTAEDIGKIWSAHNEIGWARW
jgi:hypothetical protein